MGGREAPSAGRVAGRGKAFLQDVQQNLLEYDRGSPQQFVQIDSGSSVAVLEGVRVAKDEAQRNAVLAPDEFTQLPVEERQLTLEVVPILWTAQRPS